MVENHHITSVCVQGYRESMEDTVLIEELDIKGWYFALVFDGHGGGQVSEYLANNFMSVFRSMYMWERIQRNSGNNSDSDIISLLSDFCFIMDEEIRLNVKDSNECGSTCSGVLMTPLKYYTINIGDSRTVLLSNNSTKELTCDHKPNNPEEHQRIYKAGSFVQLGRIDGILALSRSFGDFSFKKPGEFSYKDRPVTCHPDINVYTINPDDQYIIIGTDGIWDKYSSIRCGQRLLEIHDNIDFYKSERLSSLMKNLNISNSDDNDDNSVHSNNTDETEILEDSNLHILENQLFVNSELVLSSLESGDNVSVILIKLH